MSPFLALFTITTISVVFIGFLSNLWLVVIIFWITITSLILIIFIITLVKNPNLMMNAGYNLELRRLDFKLGQMNKPLQIEDAQIVYQPQRKTISARARIVKNKNE